MKFRRYLKRVSNLETDSFPPSTKLKQRTNPEHPTTVEERVSRDQSDDCASVSQIDEVE